MPDQLDPPDALDIAVRCVKRVSGQDSEETDQLGDVGIPDTDAVNELKDTIVNEEIGVKQDGFTMKTKDLDGMSPKWTVGAVGRRIRKKARPE